MYRTSLGKESRQCGSAVHRGSPALTCMRGGPSSCACAYVNRKRLPRSAGAHYVPHQTICKKHAKARQRRRRTATERLQRDRTQAQHAAKALQQALDDLGRQRPRNRNRWPLTESTAAVGQDHWSDVSPTVWVSYELGTVRVRGWDKNLPSRLLGALPKRSWLKRLRRLGLEVLIPLWRHPPVKVRPREAAGSGPGSAMTRYSKSMGSS